MKRSPIPKRASGARFFAYSHPQFQNVTTAVECSTLVLSLNPVSNFMVERGGKRKLERCSLKRMFWVSLTEV